MKILMSYIFVIVTFISTKISAEPTTVVSHPWVYETNLSRYDLVRIFTRKDNRWKDGHKITVFIKGQDSLEHRIFVMDILQLTPYKYHSIVDSVVYSGETTPPIEVATDSEMIDTLSKTPYSIGYLNYTVLISDDKKISKITILNYD